MSIGEQKSDHKIVKKTNTRSQNYEKAQKNKKTYKLW
jgi:hypothetical protein